MAAMAYWMLLQYHDEYLWEMVLLREKFIDCAPPESGLAHPPALTTTSANRLHVQVKAKQLS
jgi:hypothetical protein